MNKNIFFISIFLTLVIVITACNSIGVTDDPYGPTLNCDPDEPIDEIVKCVNDKYAFMDSAYESPRLKEIKRYHQKNKDRDDYTLIPTNYRKIDKFEDIKSCRSQLDACQFMSNGDGRGLVFYDEYDNLKIRVDSSKSISGEYFATIKTPKRDKHGWVDSFLTKPQLYPRSYINLYRDVIISQKDKQKNVYSTLIEIIKINQEKALNIVTIQKLCPYNTDKLPDYIYKPGFELTHFESCGVYRFYYVSNHINRNLVPLMSLDKRINPQKLYIRIREDTFEVDLIN